MNRLWEKVMCVLVMTLGVHFHGAESQYEVRPEMDLEENDDSSPNDATLMGRTAATDMGSLMASVPIKIYRPTNTKLPSWNVEPIAVPSSVSRNAEDFNPFAQRSVCRYDPYQDESLPVARENSEARTALLPTRLGIPPLPLFSPPGLFTPVSPLISLLTTGLNPLMAQRAALGHQIPIAHTTRRIFYKNPIPRHRLPVKSSFTPHSFYKQLQPLVLRA